MNPGDTLNGSLSQDEATARISALLGADEPEENEEEDGEEADNVEDEEDDSDSEGEDEADDEGDDEEPKHPAGKLHTVKIDGEEFQVTEEELRNGYQRQADYTRKTTALAESRKALEAEVNETRGARNQFVQLSQALLTQMQQMAPQEPDWARLEVEDPIGFAQQWAKHQQHRTRVEALQRQHQAALAQQQQDEIRQLQATVEGEKQKLTAAIPEWSDNERAAREKTEMANFAKSHGFTDDELSQVYDHRTMVILRKAMLFDQMQKNRAKVKQEIQAGRKAAPVIGPGGAQTTKGANTQKAAKQFRQTGSVNDAARLIERML